MSDRNGARPRVLVLTTTLPAREGDGTPEFVLALARALQREFEIHIVAPRVRGARLSDRVDGVMIRRFPYFPHRWEGLAADAILPTLRAQPWRVVEVPFLLGGLWLAGVRAAYGIDPSVVHAHWLIPNGLVAMSIRWLRGIPYVVTAHAADVYALNAAPLRFLKRLVMRFAHVVTAVSNDMASRIGLPAGEIDRLVVPFGVDVQAVQRAVGERVVDHGKFLFVGRLADKKGVDVLLRALATVPEARLVIVGDGPEAPALKELARSLDVDARVRFAGRQPRAAVMEELRTAYALVIPSTVGRGGDRDGTPVVMCEAMAAGVPVIASALGGLAEHIVSGETGLLVERGSSASLGAALRRALTSSEEVAGWAVRAKERMRGVLDLETTGARYRAFLESALAEDGKGSPNPSGMRRS